MKVDVKNIGLFILILFVGSMLAELVCFTLLHLERHTLLFSGLYSIIVMPFMYYYKRYIEYCSVKISIWSSIAFGIIVLCLLLIFL